ncbi:carbonic anhydrase [Gimesia algae]|uniref:carbonic anhydrase n=1 Tax=Gimesia algae TaxID=2527971 RepID=A0A517VB41_9PLAN|nr:carbonic anhydrase [Gimesia algae]QDT90208.1 Carbonic anhydrase [Gimesia algae]
MVPFTLKHTCQCMKEALNHGNMEFVELLRSEHQQMQISKTDTDSESQTETRIAKNYLEPLGLPGEIPPQLPKAAVLACSDARVPVLELFQQQPNQIFEVQLEGNVASTECLGSITYAVEHFPTVEGVVVLGHTGCGAVSAAVDQYLNPRPDTTPADNTIRSLISSITPSVEIAASALSSNPDLLQGRLLRESLDRTRLIDTSIFVNAAVMAWKIQEYVKRLSRKVPVWYGIYDLASCRILHVDLEHRDGSLLFGLGNAPGVIDLNDVAKCLSLYLKKMNTFDAARFASNGLNRNTEEVWERLSGRNDSSAAVQKNKLNRENTSRLHQ